MNRLTRRCHRIPHRATRIARRGTAMIVAIVCLLLVTTICFSLVRYALAANQQAERQGWRLQSIWLAESALAGAASRLRDDPEFAGDIWTVETIDGTSATGRVDVTVTAVEANNRRRTISVTAEFPVDDHDRVRTTRTLTLTLPATGPADTN